MKNNPTLSDDLPVTEHYDEPPHLPVSNMENFMLLVLPVIILAILVAFCIYMRYPVDNYQFERHSEITK